MMDIEKLAREAGIHNVSAGSFFGESTMIAPMGSWKRFAALVAEEAAKVCESLFDMDDDSCSEAEHCAAAIRERFKVS